MKKIMTIVCLLMLGVGIGNAQVLILSDIKKTPGSRSTLSIILDL